MRKLLTADFRRIMRKRSFWIALVLALAATVFGTVDGIDGAPQRGLKFTSSIMNITGTVDLLFGLVVLLSVFGDEFRSMTLISVIGRGISRWKFILAKFLDSLFLLGQMYLLYGLGVMLMRRVLGVSLTPAETRAVVSSIVTALYSTLAVVTLSALFFYLTGSAPFGVFMFLTLDVILPVVIVFAKMLPQVARFHPDRWYIFGFASRAAADFTYGSTAAGVLVLALGCILYIGSALALTWAVFREKELDF